MGKSTAAKSPPNPLGKKGANSCGKAKFRMVKNREEFEKLFGPDDAIPRNPGQAEKDVKDLEKQLGRVYTCKVYDVIDAESTAHLKKDKNSFKVQVATPLSKGGYRSHMCFLYFQEKWWYKIKHDEKYKISHGIPGQQFLEYYGIPVQ